MMTSEVPYEQINSSLICNIKMGRGCEIFMLKLPEIRNSTEIFLTSHQSELKQTDIQKYFLKFKPK